MTVSVMAIVACQSPFAARSIDVNQMQIALANPAVTIKTVNYRITGTTAQQLRQQMNQLGPLDQHENRRFDARTNWHVYWNYRYAQAGDRCRITSASIRTDVVFTLPQWAKPQHPPQTLVNQWNRYLQALQRHENGHKDHGIAAGNEILNQLQTFSIPGRCDQITTAANTAARQIIAKYGQQDVAYDRATNHGATQGARFP